MKRYGSIIKIKENKTIEYKILHAAIWLEVYKMIKDCNIENYSIYLRKLPDEKYYLFSYFEYTGQDFLGTNRGWLKRCWPKLQFYGQALNILNGADLAFSNQFANVFFIGMHTFRTWFFHR